MSLLLFGDLYNSRITRYVSNGAWKILSIIIIDIIINNVINIVIIIWEFV